MRVLRFFEWVTCELAYAACFIMLAAAVLFGPETVFGPIVDIGLAIDRLLGRAARCFWHNGLGCF